MTQESANDDRDVSRRAVLYGSAGVLAGLSMGALLPGRASAAQAVSTTGPRASAGGATASVSADGTYTITATNPDFQFAGTVGTTATNISPSTAGRDPVGAYHEIAFEYTAGGVGRTGSIRTYDSLPVVLFSTTYTQAADNVSPFYAFPAFSQRPMLQYSETFAIEPFAPYVFNTTGDPGFSPYLAFDDTGAYMVSPASQFPTGVLKTINDAFVSVTSDGISAIPAGFNYRTALVYGSGAGEVFGAWGNAMTGWSGKRRPAQDATSILAKLGYWTDHLSYYYYSADLPGVLQQVRAHWKSLGLPMGYMQLDSWWYPKGPDASWTDNADGIYLYEADPTLFPNGLRAFQTSIDVPLVTHSRWIDPSSPYHQQYEMSGEVIIDRAYWNNRMNYLAANGVATFEQDWLGSYAQPAFDLNDRGLFLGNMAAAASSNGMDIQYCMPLPCDYLQSTLYDNVTNVRVSGDGFTRDQWDSFMYVSHLASALGAWPWADVTMSADTTCLLLQNLSAGPVGVGDAIGSEDLANLHMVMLADGTIVKPDTSIVPTDGTYLSDAAGTGGAMVATAVSRHGALCAGYVFAYARSTSASANASFAPSDMGITGAAYVYDFFAGTGVVVNSDETYTAVVDYNGSYFQVVPVGPSGIGFLGDAGKFVSLGKQRISRLSDTGSVRAEIAFASGDGPVTLHGYAPAAVSVTATGASAGSLTYNPTTQQFSVVITPHFDNSVPVIVDLRLGGH
jgi:hypothetical protein